MRLNPDPRRAMKDITHLLTYLTAPVSQGGCGWAYEHMHALGFAQGGSVLLETLIATRANTFGSAVSVCGPLLSLPTFSPPLAPRVCFVTRDARTFAMSSASRSHVTAVQRAFCHVTHLHYTDPAQSMIHGAEWQDIMQFWSRHWRHRMTWELQGDVQEVAV